MNTIKIKSIYILVCVIGLSLSSCKKLVELGTPPVSDYSSENLFKTVAQARMTVFAIYTTFTEDTYSRRIATTFSADTDETQVQGGVDPTGRRQLARYASTPSGVNSDMYPVWNRLYAGIERANICIRRIPEMDLYKNGSDADKKELQRLYGEALTLRAYYYFDLVKMWGDVPFRITPSEAGQDFFTNRVNRDIIYDQIIKDLQEAIALVPWRKEVPAQARWTKGAIKGILARIALHAAGYSLRWDLATKGNLGMRARPDAAKVREYYELARTQTLDIINDPAKNHTLNPDFKNIWMTLCGMKFDTQYGESMFEIGFWNPTGEQAYNGYIGNKIGVPSASPVFGKGGSEIRVLSTYSLSFNALDTRKAVTIADFNIDATGKRVLTNRLYEYNPGKWRVWWAPVIGNQDYTGINWIILRYADVLLMYAEADAYLKNGSTPEAIAALKLVRKRAYKGNESKIDAETYPADYAGFLNVLMKERAWELGTEGIRKWDLIRWNKIAEVISNTQKDLVKLSNDATVPLYVYYLPTTDVEKENDRVYGNTSAVPAPYSAQGYIQTQYRNTLNTNVGFFAQGFTVDKTELFPIPQGAIDDNPILSQHPSY